MLSAERIETILSRLPGLAIGVVGDLFLDQYLHLDDRLTEPSLETGLDAYQVVNVVNSPGAAGTVLNNLVALGVGRVAVLSFIGIDGRGADLKRELRRRGVEVKHLLETQLRHTPTYLKPMLGPKSPRELNRFDVKNRTATPAAVEQSILDTLPQLWREVDALLVVDQVTEPDCGVVTSRVRELLATLGERDPGKLLLADSRRRIGLFKNCCTKPNAKECLQAAMDGGRSGVGCDLDRAILWLARQTNRPVLCTSGESGMTLVDPSGTTYRHGDTHPRIERIPAYLVAGPTDVVGAGDSASAGIACAYAVDAGLAKAAAFGNLVASVTIQQLGTTGTATPAQVRARWLEVQSRQ